MPASAPIAHLFQMGFLALPDLAHATGTTAKTAYTPTVADDDGRGETIDLILINNEHMYVPGSYLVHPATTSPTGQRDSDHHLVTCVLNAAA